MGAEIFDQIGSQIWKRLYFYILKNWSQTPQKRAKINFDGIFGCLGPKCFPKKIFIHFGDGRAESVNMFTERCHIPKLILTFPNLVKTFDVRFSAGPQFQVVFLCHIKSIFLKLCLWDKEGWFIYHLFSMKYVIMLTIHRTTITTYGYNPEHVWMC